MADTTLLEFIRYNNWANQQVLAVCQTLSEAQLDSDIAGAFGTIRSTIEHIVRSETWYLLLLTGERPLPPFDWKLKPSMADLAAFAEQVAERWVDAAGRVATSARVHEEEGDTIYEYTALAVYIQIINHGIEHRTNITTLLNQWGMAVPDVAGWGYLLGNPERFDYRAQ